MGIRLKSKKVIPCFLLKRSKIDLLLIFWRYLFLETAEKSSFSQEVFLFSRTNQCVASPLSLVDGESSQAGQESLSNSVLNFTNLMHRTLFFKLGTAVS